MTTVPRIPCDTLCGKSGYLIVRRIPIHLHLMVSKKLRLPSQTRLQSKYRETGLLAVALFHAAALGFLEQIAA